MLHEIVFAGFGGQGVLFAAQALAYAAMAEGTHVAWVPSYGPEMRGGTAASGVIVSDEEIGSLLITEPTVAVVMNSPSFDKYEDLVVAGGILIVNRSLIDRAPRRSDIVVIDVPASEIAAQMGNDRLANVVILGAVVAATRVVSEDSVMAVLKKTLTGKKAQLLAANEAAFRRGMGFRQ